MKSSEPQNLLLNRIQNTVRQQKTELATLNPAASTLKTGGAPQSTRTQPVEESPPLQSQVQIDYRDRISVATWLLVFSMGLRLLFTLANEASLEFRALGTPVTIRITDYVIAGLTLGGLAAFCTDSILSIHPFYRESSSVRLFSLNGLRRRIHLLLSWALPIAITIIATVLLPKAPTRQIQIVGLLIYAVAIATTFFSLYATVETGQIGFRRGRTTLNTFTYGAALLLFLTVYQTRSRSLLSGTMVTATAALLAVELLRSATPRSPIVIIYGMIVGLILGEVTWALNYWPIVDLTGGLLLALIFYLLVGIAQQGLQQRLTRQVLIEYALFALIALILITFVGRGFQDIRSIQPEASTLINGL